MLVSSFQLLVLIQDYLTFYFALILLAFVTGPVILNLNLDKYSRMKVGNKTILFDPDDL